MNWFRKKELSNKYWKFSIFLKIWSKQVSMRFENDSTEKDEPYKLRTKKSFFRECFDLRFFWKSTKTSIDVNSVSLNWIKYLFFCLWHLIAKSKENSISIIIAIRKIKEFLQLSYCIWYISPTIFWFWITFFISFITIFLFLSKK